MLLTDRHVSIYFRYDSLLRGRKGKGEYFIKSRPQPPTYFERNTLFGDPTASL